MVDRYINNHPSHTILVTNRGPSSFSCLANSSTHCLCGGQRIGRSSHFDSTLPEPSFALLPFDSLRLTEPCSPFLTHSSRTTAPVVYSHDIVLLSSTIRCISFHILSSLSPAPHQVAFTSSHFHTDSSNRQRPLFPFVISQLQLIHSPCLTSAVTPVRHT